MAEPKTPKPPAQGKGLKGKVGGIPIPVIAIGVLVAIGVGLYIRHRSATAQTAAAATPASGTDTSGGAGSAAATPQDLTPISDLASSINGLVGILGSAGAGFPSGGDGSSTFGGIGTGGIGTTTIQPVAPGSIGAGGQGTSTGGFSWPAPVGTVLPPIQPKPVAQVKPGSVPNQGPGTITDTYSLGNVPAFIPNANAFGGIVSQKKTASGVKIVTYASGRVVEQAPGKTPYVAKKGK